MNIFEIDTRILNCVDTDTGEIIDEDTLKHLQMQRDTKIENVALWIKELKAESEAIAQEVKSLNHRKKVAENKAESLKKYLKYALNGQKFETPKVSVSYRKNESVEITDIDALDKRFLRYKDPEPDKTAIKEAIKDGELIIDGARLVVNQNMIVG